MLLDFPKTFLNVCSISDQVVKDIRQRILYGDLEIGSKLPSENELKEIYHVSRNSIRDALKKLMDQGYLVANVGKNGGYYISEIPEETLSNFDANREEIILRLDNLKIEEIVEMRNIIEIQSAALAAERRTDQHLMNIKKQINRLQHDEIGRLNFYLGDLVFHKSLAIASQNQFLVMSLLAIIHSMSTFMIHRALPEPLRDDLLQDLWLIYEAVEKQDSQAAQFHMKNHLQRI